MRDFMEFLLYAFSASVESLFEIDIGGYSYGAMLTAVCILSVFVSTLVLRFRSSGDVTSVSRPLTKKKIEKYKFNKYGTKKG